MKSASLALVILIGMALSACASLSPNRYDDGEGMAASATYNAVVLHVRAVETQDSGDAGTAFGVVLGALAFSHFGSGTGKAVSELFGATAGAGAGSGLDKAASRSKAVELVLLVQDGRYRQTLTVVQGDEIAFNPGERVYLIQTRSHSVFSGESTRLRVVPAA